MTNRIDELLAELGATLEGVFPEGSDNHAHLDLPSGATLTVIRSEAFERLFNDATSWRTHIGGEPETMDAQETLRLLGSPEQ